MCCRRAVLRGAGVGEFRGADERLDAFGEGAWRLRVQGVPLGKRIDHPASYCSDRVCLYGLSEPASEQMDHEYYIACACILYDAELLRKKDKVLFCRFNEMREDLCSRVPPNNRMAEDRLKHLPLGEIIRFWRWQHQCQLEESGDQ